MIQIELDAASVAQLDELASCLGVTGVGEDQGAKRRGEVVKWLLSKRLRLKYALDTIEPETVSEWCSLNRDAHDLR